MPHSRVISSVSFSFMQTKYYIPDENVDAHSYQCGKVGDGLKDCQTDSAEKANICYCDGSAEFGCQDVSACRCAGDDRTKYASKKANIMAALEAAGSGSDHVVTSRLAVSTLAAALVIGWLL